MCECLPTINSKLRETHNTIVSSTLGRPSRAVVSTLRFDCKVRGKPVAMIASYCPFCGENYEEVPA